MSKQQDHRMIKLININIVIKTLIFSFRIGGSGQTCCYDDYNELLQTADTMYGGRPSRAHIYGKHPFKTRMTVCCLYSFTLLNILSNRFLHSLIGFMMQCHSFTVVNGKRKRTMHTPAKCIIP